MAKDPQALPFIITSRGGRFHRLMRTTTSRPNTLSLIDEDEEEEEVVICRDGVILRSGRGGRNDGVWQCCFGGVRVSGVKRFRLIWGGKNGAIGFAQICSKPKNDRICWEGKLWVANCRNFFTKLRFLREGWVCLVGFDLLLIDGGGGFDYEKSLLLFWVWLWEHEVWFWVCSCSGFDLHYWFL